MPDAQFPQSYSAKKELLLSSQQEEEITSDVPPSPQTLNIETLKYFMDEDLKLGFSHREIEKRRIENFCMYQHEEDEVECEIYIKRRAVENWRNTIFRWNLIFLFEDTSVAPHPTVWIHVRISSLAQIFIQ